jgi:hypothetical protein
VEGASRKSAEQEEEDILKHNRLLCKAEKVVVFGIVRHSGVLGGLLLDARPCQVDIEEQEENTQADYRGLLHISVIKIACWIKA